MTQTISSNILAVFQMDTEFIHFESHSDEFFLNLRSKNLNHCRLFLTDRKNRPLPQDAPGTSQGTKGNLFFSAVIRIDVMQTTIPQTLKVKPRPLPDYKNIGVMNSLPYGDLPYE